MPKKFPDIESTIEFPVEGKLFRLWIDEQEVKDDYPETEAIYEQIKDFALQHKDLNDQIDFISKIPRVNAVQIKDKGFPEVGVVVYFVDFSDPHG